MALRNQPRLRRLRRQTVRAGSPGCADWFTTDVETHGEIDDAIQKTHASKSGAYIEIIGGRMDLPPALAFAHGRLSETYGKAPARGH
jgi:hypothetical protein